MATRSPKRTPTLRLLAAALVMCASMPLTSLAAGGHHSVDDAALLDAGQCQLQTWAERDQRGGRALAHLEPACRVGPVELSIGLEREKVRGDSAATVFGPQVKWAMPLTDALSIGLIGSARLASGSPRFSGTTLVVPLTWQLSDTLATHVNLGRDFQRQGRDESRGGVALEWAALPAWSFVAERFRESSANATRLGARWEVLPGASIDVSQA